MQTGQNKLFPPGIVPDLSEDGHIVPKDIFRERTIRILRIKCPWITVKEIDQYLNEELRLFFEGIPFDLCHIKGLTQENAKWICKAHNVAIYWIK